MRPKLCQHKSLVFGTNNVLTTMMQGVTYKYRGTRFFSNDFRRIKVRLGDLEIKWRGWVAKRVQQDY